jgi:hypothetical protein
MHRGHITPVYAFGAIGYNYKSRLLFIYGSGKNGAFTQADYLARVLKPLIKATLAAFKAVVAKTGQKAQFMEDGNSAYGHKSTSNVCVI